MDTKELLRRLFTLTYRSSSGGYEFDVISRSEQSKVRDAVNGWAITQDANKVIIEKEKEKAELYNKIGELSAKVYAYEQIISKSNFALIIPEEAIESEGDA